MWFIFSYWRAPSQRAPGGALQNAFSQLQQPTSLVHPQAQQGLQVLDTLLSTLGQIGGDSQVGGGSGLNRSRQSDRHPNIGHMQPKNRYANELTHELIFWLGPGQGINKYKRPRRRYGRQDNRQQDNYGQGRSYDSGMMNLGEETSGMNYGNDDSFGYGRSNNMGNSR
ncbi:hypothetical protein LSH36_127g16065, partial [Paralvinella palmiformis]